MKIKHLGTTESAPAKAHRVQKTVLLGKEDGCPNFVVRHFRMEAGGHGFPHRHDYEHGIFVLGGRAKLVIDGEEAQIGSGDAFAIPPNALHTMENAGDQPFVFLCTIPAHANEEERVFIDPEASASR